MLCLKRDSVGSVDSDSVELVVLGAGVLQFCISDELPGDASAAGP